MNLINKAFYECLNEGDINGLPFTFPIPTVNITENFDWDGENTDLLLKMLQNMDLLISKILLVRNINEMKMVI